MTQQAVLARTMIFNVLAADLATYIEVGGINSVKINPGENEESADITTFVSEGQYESLITQRGASMTLEGLFYLDEITGVRDTGQLRCETLAAAIGTAGQAGVRFRYPQQTSWKVWAAANFSLGEQGGGNNDVSAFAVTVSRSGASTTAIVA